MELTAACQEGEHEACPHVVGFGAVFLARKKRRGPSVVLCQCACHEQCPTPRDRFVSRDVWRSACTCPGAEEYGQGLEHRERDMREMQAPLREALGQIDLTRRRGAEEIRSELLAAYGRHGVEPFSDLRGMASILEAVSGPRWFRLPRLVRHGIRSYRQLSEDDRRLQARRAVVADGDDDWHGFDDDERQLRVEFRLYAAYGVCAVALAIAARRTSGAAKIVLVTLSLLLAVVTAWSVLVVGGIRLLVKWARTRLPPDEDQDVEGHPAWEG